MANRYIALLSEVLPGYGNGNRFGLRYNVIFGDVPFHFIGTHGVVTIVDVAIRHGRQLFQAVFSKCGSFCYR